MVSYYDLYGEEITESIEVFLRKSSISSLIGQSTGLQYTQKWRRTRLFFTIGIECLSGHLRYVMMRRYVQNPSIRGAAATPHFHELLPFPQPFCEPTSHPVIKALLQNKNTTYLLHRSQHPCRKIQFHLSSHDQGWGAGTPNSYEGSFTWFDVESIPQADQEILRQSHRAADHKSSSPSPPSPPFPSSQSIPTLGGEYRLQTNRNQRGIPRSRIVWDEYDITWRWNDDIPSDSEEAVRIRMEEGRGEKTLDGEFVRSLRPGDSVVVWGRARFPGWTNFVNRLSVRMFWAV
ncbi:hypothetical protein KEM54_003344 [Ascosphaera aggregata]|nr:hypothetical protein KEM54_003344 [Ascosphaera aggregata]